MTNRLPVLAGTLVALLGLAASAGATRYTGDVTDARSGKSSDAKISTKPTGADLKARIRCKPRLGCPLAKRTKVLLEATGETYRYAGTFTLHGMSCSLDAYIYPAGFQGTYRCSDGSVGSIGGFSGGGGGGEGEGGGGGGGREHPGRD